MMVNEVAPEAAGLVKTMSKMGLVEVVVFQDAAPCGMRIDIRVGRVIESARTSVSGIYRADRESYARNWT
jgi:hypothetical protein